MELIKRLEGEVIELARELGQNQYFLELDRHTVDPHQFIPYFPDAPAFS